MKYLLFLFILTSCGPIPHSEPSCTFIQNEFGERVSWYYAPVILGIDRAMPSHLKPAIYAAAQQWNTSYGAELIRIVDGYQYNMIMYQTTWQTSSAFQAITVVQWYNNVIYQATVNVNAHDHLFYYNAPAYGVEFKSLMIHELGHVLGLAHSDGVMSPYLAEGVSRWDISSTILNNLTCEY